MTLSIINSSPNKRNNNTFSLSLAKVVEMVRGKGYFGRNSAPLLHGVNGPPIRADRQQGG